MLLLRAVKNSLELSVFRHSPSEMPYSVWVLAALLILNIALKIFLLGFNFNIGWVLTLGTLLWLAAFVWLTCYWCRKPHRFLQTYNSVLGTLAVVLIVMLVFDQLGIHDHWIGFALLIWSLAILSNIMRASLEISVFLAVIMTLAFEILRLSIMYHIVLLFGVPA